jgi:hypothetical protein
LHRGNHIRGLAIVLCVGLCAGRAATAADEGPICADRPGKATSTCTVPAGHWQVETGIADWTLQKEGGERDTAVVLGETTLKFGLNDGSDVEVDFAPWQRAMSRGPGFGEQSSGISDIRIIYKRMLTSADAPLQVSLYPYVKIPTAKRPLGNGKWEGALLIPMTYSIGKSPFTINLTPEVDWVADGDRHGYHPAMSQVASLGWQLNDKLNLSGELWGHWDWDSSGTTRQASIDGAVAYLLTNSVQLDAGANFGLNRVTPDVDIYAGLSKRF